MASDQKVNPNISSDYKVSLFLGGELDPSFYSNYERYRDVHSEPHARDSLGFRYEGYVFSLCTQDNHLKWLDQAETIADAEMAEHFALQLLLDLGFYTTDELAEDS
jgi:hypothetical protein